MAKSFPRLLISGFVLSIPVVLLAQTQLDPRPVFEVASIKPTDANDSSFRFRIEPDGTTVASGITLKRLLMTAYNVQGFRVVGGPPWVDSRRWNIQAKHDGNVSIDQTRQMLVTLIGNRFHLRAHDDTRTLPVYELAVAPGGARIPMTKDPDVKPTVRVAPGSLQLTNATPATFASQLSYAVARSVIDKTNLRGRFDFVLEWTPFAGEDGGPATSGLPRSIDDGALVAPQGVSIFTAIREQLGLRVKNARAPVNVIVIDHVERPTQD